jgi:excisionase family DNA binding protein
MGGIMPEYLSIKDVAEHLNVGYKTVYRLVRQGEIPAAKVGGVYRIHRDDLRAYLQEQKWQVAPSSYSETKTTPLMKCGVCLRLLHDEHDIGERCTFEKCDVPICTRCWHEGKRYCITHRPSRTEELQKAQQQLRRGELPVVVNALEARQREKNYTARFDTKVQRITKIWHPLRSQIINPSQPWSQLHQATDEAETLMKLLHTGFLEEDVEQSMPLNMASRYHLPDESPKAPGLILEARMLAHLTTFVEQGYDTQPATLQELDRVLDTIVQEAEEREVAYLVGVASPTGWTAEAQEYIATGEAGSTFHHRFVLPCLVDLADLQVFHNPADDRLTPLVSLFSPRLSTEEVARAIAYIKRALVMSSGVSVQEVHAETGIDEALIHQAFSKLEENGSHRVEEIEGIGQVIIRADR